MIFGGDDGCGGGEAQLHAATDALLAGWPMAGAAEGCAAAEGGRRSATSFASLKGHLMRYAHRSAAAASDPAAIADFRMRVQAGHSIA